MGIDYYNGTDGVDQDNAKAMFYYRKAAMGGNAQAMRRVGEMYDNGLSVAQNNRRATSWSRKAANAGDAGAMRDVGVDYDQGVGVAQDFQQAMAWYRKAAAAGDGGGDDEPRLSIRQRPWSRQRFDASLGLVPQGRRHWGYKQEIPRNVGVDYDQGIGVGQDFQQAMIWYQKAAAAGDAGSMVGTSVFYTAMAEAWPKTTRRHWIGTGRARPPAMRWE